MNLLALAIVLILAVSLTGCTSVEVSTKPATTPKSLPTKTPEPRGSYANPASVGEAVIVKTFSGTF